MKSAFVCIKGNVRSSGFDALPIQGKTSQDLSASLRDRF